MTNYVNITLALFSFVISSLSWPALAQAQDGLSSPPSLQSTEIFTKEEKTLIQSGRIFKVCNVIQQASNDASLGIVKLIAGKSGLKFEATPLIPWAEALKGLKEGRCHVLPWATKTEERSKVMNFTRPYVRIKRVVVSKKQEPYIRDLDEVSDKVFAMLKSNYAVTQIRKNYPHMQFVYVDT
ncbi:MAG: transporter substrate-binding domain-containing protein, partial [Kangiellaceae bacterium]|nr:transporter substrate-binding domain-containing protein [Kangiellaceae bacterium]